MPGDAAVMNVSDERRAGDERALRFDFGRVAVGDVARSAAGAVMRFTFIRAKRGSGQLHVVGMVDEVPHDWTVAPRRRTRSCGAARR